MTVRAASEQSIPEELIQRIGDLTARFVALSEYIRRATRPSVGAGTKYLGSAQPIEFLTENGFAIVREWEADSSPAPTNASFCFLVRDPGGLENHVTVTVANQLLKETEFATRGRIQVLSSFWMCCAERRLADYLEEHEHVPDKNKLNLEILDCEAVMLAFRWERPDL